MATERPPPASFSTLPPELKAAIVELVYRQDVARNRRITTPTIVYDSDEEDSEDQDEDADSDDDVIVDEDSDPDGDGENWDDDGDSDEYSESGELSYLGRGIPALSQVDRALNECSAVYMFQVSLDFVEFDVGISLSLTLYLQAIKASMVRRPAFRSLVLPNRKSLVTTIFFATRTRAYYGRNSPNRIDVLSRQLAFIQTALSMTALPNLSTVVFTDELAQAYLNGQDEYHDLTMAIAPSAEKITTLSLLQHTAEQAAAAIALFPRIKSLHIYLAGRTTSLQPLLDILCSLTDLMDLSIYPLKLVEPTRVREGPTPESLPVLRRLHFGGTFYGRDLSIFDLLMSSSETLEVLSIGGGDDRSPVGGDDGRGRFRPTFLEPVPSLLLHVPSNSPLPPAPRVKRTVFRHIPSLPRLRQLDVVSGSTEHIDHLLMLPALAASPIKILNLWIASVAPSAPSSPEPPRSPSSDTTSEPFSDVVVHFISRHSATLKLIDITDRKSVV